MNLQQQQHEREYESDEGVDTFDVSACSSSFRHSHGH